MNRVLMNGLRAFAGIATLVFGLAACGPDYDRTEISAVKESAFGGTVNTQRLEVPVGLVVTAHVVVWNDDNEQMSLGIRSKDPQTVEIAGVVNPRNYSFIGKKEGQTEIEFLADGNVVLTIVAIVSKQRDMP